MTTRRTLLERVRAGDEEAWERFHALYAPMLLRYAASSGLSDADAEEIRDRCLAKLARRLPGFRYDPRKGRFQAWLFRIVRHEIVDHARRRKLDRADTSVLGAVPAREPGPDEAWEREWREAHLRWALAEARRELSPRTYRAFEMLLVDGASVADVCARLGTTPNGVYQAKRRALDRVRAILRRLGAE